MMINSISIHKLTLGMLETNCYIVSKKGEKEAFLIDPGADGDTIKETLQKLGVTAVAVLLTHAHFDHTGALADFSDLPIYIGEKEAPCLNNPSYHLGRMVGDRNPRPDPTTLLKDGDSFSVAGMDISVIFTPGHSMGGVCYLVDDAVLFSGDTLFYQGRGRDDFPGGDPQTLTDSLQKLFSLEKDYPVYPGHGPSTRLYEEKMR